MEPTTVEVGTIYKRNEQRFEVQELVQVKDPDDANWKEGVKYIPIDTATILPYVRTTSDFLKKYKLIGAEDDSSSQDLHRGKTHWVEPGKN